MTETAERYMGSSVPRKEDSDLLTGSMADYMIPGAPEIPT